MGSTAQTQKFDLDRKRKPDGYRRRCYISRWRGRKLKGLEQKCLSKNHLVP